MLLEIRHVTRYQYDEPVRESLMEVWMQPQKRAEQRLISFELEVEPAAQLFSLRRHLRQRCLPFRTCPSRTSA